MPLPSSFGVLTVRFVIITDKVCEIALKTVESFTYLGGKIIWTVWLAGRRNVFSVTLKSAELLAPSKIFTRVGVSGGK